MKKKFIAMAAMLIMLSGCAANNTDVAEETAPAQTTEIVTESETETIEDTVTETESAETMTELITESATEAETEAQSEITDESVDEMVDDIVEDDVLEDDIAEGDVTEDDVSEDDTAEDDTAFDVVIVDYCALTQEAVEAAHPYIEGRTEEEVNDLLTVLTDEEFNAFFPTDEDMNAFIQSAKGRDGNMFRDVTLVSIANASAECDKFYNADCDIVFDFEGYEGIPVAVYYSKPKFLVYDWSLLVADAFGYDAEKIRAFCESEDYEMIKTADVADARKILKAHGGDPIDWA